MTRSLEFFTERKDSFISTNLLFTTLSFLTADTIHILDVMHFQELPKCYFIILDDVSHIV